jgi:hypothetical protein
MSRTLLGGRGRSRPRSWAAVAGGRCRGEACRPPDWPARHRHASRLAARRDAHLDRRRGLGAHGVVSTFVVTVTVEESP